MMEAAFGTNPNDPDARRTELPCAVDDFFSGANEAAARLRAEAARVEKRVSTPSLNRRWAEFRVQGLCSS
jgi:hypothetical protein